MVSDEGTGAGWKERKKYKGTGKRGRGVGVRTDILWVIMTGLIKVY